MASAKFAMIEIPEFSTGENFETLFENEASNDSLKEGNVVKGTVVGMEKDFVIVDVGLKSEGRVPLKEFSLGGGSSEVAVGDVVEVYLERIENRAGEAVLSREKALREEAWVKLEESCANGERVDGVIFSRVKGGFTVDLMGAVAFLPGSQVDIRPVKDVGPLMNITQPFQILKMDRKRGNIVVSRRAILEESRAESRNDILSRIAEGEVFEGIVKNLTDYGAFVDMGGIDGLLHVTDISWKRINNPSEVLSLGQTIQVVVTKYDETTKRVSLGMKQLEDNPWKGADEKYPVGTKCKGKVTNVTDYGAFVELEGGIEGLVHVSEVSWTKKNTHPSKLLSVSEEVDVMVLDIDMAKNRISLGIKQCQENPWQIFADNNKEGQEIEGEIRNITDFGLFVGLADDLDGLVHHSDISWTESGDAAIKLHEKGAMVKAKILAIDPEKERISLGIKQMEENPVGEAFVGITKGATVTCVVSAVQNDGVQVSVNDNVSGFIKRADLSREKQEQRPDRFAVGDRLDAKVTSLDPSSNKVGLSIKALEMDQHKKAVQDYGSSDSGATLGDILGAALDEAASSKKK